MDTAGDESLECFTGSHAYESHCASDFRLMCRNSLGVFKFGFAGTPAAITSGSGGPILSPFNSVNVFQGPKGQKPPDIVDLSDHIDSRKVRAQDFR